MLSNGQNTSIAQEEETLHLPPIRTASPPNAEKDRLGSQPTHVESLRDGMLLPELQPPSGMVKKNNIVTVDIAS